MDKLLTTLNQFLTAAQSTIAKYAPEVWKATLHIIQIQAIFNIAILVLIAVVLAVGWNRLMKAIDTTDWPEEHDYQWSKGNGRITVRIILGMSWFIWTLVVLTNAFELFLRAFYPELSVLYTLAAKAGLL